MKIIERHLVENIDDKQRIQEYGLGIFIHLNTKSGLKKAIKRNQVLVNKMPTTTAYFVEQGDVIELLEFPTIVKRDYEIDLKILYEDSYLAVIYKPSGIVVSGNRFATISNALARNLKPSDAKDASFPHPVHRLDYDTSGLLIIGKSIKAKQLLHQMFEEHKIEKTYHAVCVRSFQEVEGLITEPLEDKPASTKYKVIQSEKSEKFEALNLVELNPKTGRTHQLRKHLLHIGNPIMGDKKYFIEGYQHQGYGLYLHATTLLFNHPITQEKLEISSELPKKFKRIFGLA